MSPELDRRSVLRWGVAGATAAALPLTSVVAADASEPLGWAGACGAQWREIAGALAPVLVTLSASGPGPVPAGAALRIAVDATAVAGLSVRAAQTFDGAPVVGAVADSAAGAVRTVQWTLKQPLEAGDGIQLILDAVAGARPSTPVAPIVSLVVASPDPRQRATGDEIVVPG